MAPTNTNGKHGRSQLRQVKRTSRRDFNRGQKHISTQKEPESELSLEEEEEVPKVNESGKAYEALLTLIKEEKEEIPKKKRKVTEMEGGEDDDDIAGVNFNEEEERNEEQEQDDDVIDGDSDSDDEQEDDPFQAHFNNISDDIIENKENESKWPLKSKKTHDFGYQSMIQQPPAAIQTHDTWKGIDHSHIKHRILTKFKESNASELSENDTLLLNSMLQYRDINYPTTNYTNQTYQHLYCVHALNHVYKTRDSILKNNQKLHNYQERVKQGESVEEPEFRDQGFTRPKVLILLPTRNACYEVVNLLMKYSNTDQQTNKKRFKTQFHSDQGPPDSKPQDFKYYFHGNTNDFFTIGLKFTRKAIKIYSSFYSSDIILASPIGLSMILENPDKKKRQYDFLSSIEMVIVDHANQIEMQNWDHVNTIMKYVNKIPKDFHDADFSRIRMWSINEQAGKTTQRLVFSEHLTPNINSLVNKSLNLAGKLKLKPIITNENCIMNSLGLRIRQVFQRFSSESPVDDPDARFKFFSNSILTSLSNSTSYDDGLLIVIPTYFDYVRVKNHMNSSTKLNFGAIDEYSSQSHVTKMRHQFITGKIKVLLYTERLHYFRRFEIGGVKNIILYGLPVHPQFYKEYLKFIGKSVFHNMVDLDLAFIKIIYSKWDAMYLERIVGQQRAPILSNSINEMYEFK